MHRLSLLAIATAFVSFTHAHGDHGDPEARLKGPADYEDGWAQYHMAEEHHISNVDPATFFTLHDYEGMGVWTEDDILTTYGMHDESALDVPEEKEEEIVNKVLELFDSEGAGSITKEEFVEAWNRGVRLPDFGTGPGHHGDMEYEYEIHHWEKYHADGATEEELNHPEDIEHFRRHDEMERAQMEFDATIAKGVVEANIPMKFKKQ